jgi:hypothetical protein
MKNKIETPSISKVKKFSNIVVDTINVIGEIKLLAQAKNIPTNEINFNILSYKTTYKMDEEDGWIAIKEHKQLVNFHKDISYILDNKLKIKQDYKIELYHDVREKSRKKFNLIFGVNKQSTKAVATIKSIEISNIIQS